MAGIVSKKARNQGMFVNRKKVVNETFLINSADALLFLTGRKWSGSMQSPRAFLAFLAFRLAKG